MAVAREDARRLVQLAAHLRRAQLDRAGHGHVALVAQQAVAGVVDAHQAGGAGGVHADARARQVELVRHEGGDVILLAPDLDLDLAHHVDQLRPRRDVVEVVEVVAHAGVHADEACEAVGVVAGALHGFPREFEEHALLRVHHGGFVRADAEELRIEELGVADHPAHPDVVRVGAQFLLHGRVVLLGQEARHGLAALGQHRPEILQRVGARHAAGHADDRDRFLRRMGHALALLQRDARARRVLDLLQVVLVVLVGEQRMDGRVLEQLTDADARAGAAREGRRDVVGLERVDAEFEQVGIGIHVRQPQQPGHDASQQPAQVVRGDVVEAVVVLAQVEGGQRLLVDLAVGRERQRIERHDARRHHVVGQPLREEIPHASSGRARPGAPRHDEGDQPGPAHRIDLADHGSLLDVGAFQQMLLDLAQLDAEAAHLHLVVDAADELQRAVGHDSGRRRRCDRARAWGSSETDRRRSARWSAPAACSRSVTPAPPM